MNASAPRRGRIAAVERTLTVAAAVAMTTLASLAISVYLQAPVGQLRQTITYRPHGSAAKRVAGLAAAENLALRDVPEALLLALIFREDKKFFEHHGFDLEEIRDSVRDHLLAGRRLRGASTLSQQLVRNLLLTNERTLRRKLVEAIYTVKLERGFSKSEILVLYLNNIEWGPGVYGLRAAARHYFGKPPSELAAVESAFLVSVIPNPAVLARTSASGRLPARTEASMGKLLAVVGAVTAEPGSAPAVAGIAAWERARAVHLRDRLRHVRAGFADATLATSGARTAP